MLKLLDVQSIIFLVAINEEVVVDKEEIVRRCYGDTEERHADEGAAGIHKEEWAAAGDVGSG